MEEAEKFGAQCVLTDPNLPSGTDRIATALKQIDPDGTKYDIAVNFQGDNINVDPAINNRLIKIIEETNCDIATCGMVFKTLKDAENPNNVKIVMGLEKGKRKDAPFILRGLWLLISAIRTHALIRIIIITSAFMFSKRTY